MISEDQPHLNRGEAAIEMGHPSAARVSIKGAQSFVATLSIVWRRPSLTALEVAWRWAFGIPALAVVFWRVKELLARATQGTFDAGKLGLDRTFLADPVGALSADPMGAVAKVADAFTGLRAELLPLDLWLVLALVLLWIVVSSVGRSLVLRRADAQTHARLGTLMGLQLLRTVALLALFFVWLQGLEASARVAIAAPIAAGGEPNLVLYCGLAIVLSLGMFTAWMFVSWVLSVAPLLAMLRDLGLVASLRAALRLGAVRGKLVEINLVLGIVKIALLVLAMVFSATPLPFESVTTPEFLAWWWAGVSLLYVLWSDFFHVVRMVGYLRLWRAYEGAAK